MIRIGLELGAATLRAVWVVKRFGKAQWHYREQPRGPGSRSEDVARDLAQLLRPLGRHRLGACVVLAAPASYVRQLTVSAADLKHLAGAVGERLPSVLPFDAERAQTHFILQHHERRDGAMACTVSLAACERARLQEALESLWRIGWVPRRIAPAALALRDAAKACEALSQEPAMLLDLGDRHSTMALVQSGDVVFARDVALGIDHLTDALTGQVSMEGGTLALSQDQARGLLRDAGIPESGSTNPQGSAQVPAATYQAMLQPILEQFVSEIRRTMTFAAQAGIAATPSRVVVSGSGAAMPRLDAWLSGQLAVPVSRLDCAQVLGAAAASAAIPYGLVVSAQPLALNLMPAVWRRQGATVRAAARLWQALLAVTLVVWIQTGWWERRHHTAANQINTLQTQWKNLEPAADLERITRQYQELTRRLSRQEAIPAAWWSRLAQNFPGPVRLSELSMDAKGDVQMKGQAQGLEGTPEASVSELALWLEREGLCGEVHLESTRQLSQTSSLVEFGLRCARTP